VEILRRPILESCLITGNFQFAGGDEANNKLDLERAQSIPELAGRITDRLCELAEPYQPTVLVGLPNGATGWAERMSEEMKLPVLYLKKELVVPGQKTFSLRSSHDRQYVDGKPDARLLVIEDAGSKLTSFRGALESVPYIGKNALGLVGIWRRFPPQVDKPDPKPTRWIINEYIPLNLSKRSRYRQYATAA
jgi:orotate phosphoribosyltransferase